MDCLNSLADPDSFVRAVHVTGDLENLGQGTPDDQRYFVTVADERTILHFGSSYGGNAQARREQHLDQFPDLPEEIWQAHRRVAAELDAWAG